MSSKSPPGPDSTRQANH